VKESEEFWKAASSLWSWHIYV